MAVIGRATLPEEFYDITSSMLLKQPEPQYLYAQMFKSALGASLTVTGSLGVPGREVGGNGAAYASETADRLVLSAPISTELFQAKVNFKGQMGHTMKFNRPAFTNSTATQASRKIAANTTISTTPIAAGSEQNTLTLERYAGPYDTANSRVAPYAIESFDASMGIHSLASFVGTHMRRDFDRVLDKVWVDLFDSVGGGTIYPEGMSADNDATSAGMFPLTYEQISRVSRTMDDAFLPTLGDGRRLLVVTPTGKKQLKDDPQFARYVEFHKELNPMFPGYFGSLPEFHLIQNSTLTTTANSSSVNIHTAHALAPGVAMGGMGRAPSVRYASDDNYGETPKVIWLGDFAFGLADNRFGYLVKYSQDNA